MDPISPAELRNEFGRKASRHSFVSIKNMRPIRYNQRWHRDALVQLSLDPSVIAFEAESAPLPHEVLNLIVTILGGQMRVSLVRDHTNSTDSNQAKDQIRISRSTILREPRASNARAIWATRKSIVSIGDRVRILGKLDAAPNGLKLAELLACISTSRVDPVDAILALVCQGLVTLDIEKPIAPSTTVRRSLNPRSDCGPKTALKS